MSGDIFYCSFILFTVELAGILPVLTFFALYYLSSFKKIKLISYICCLAICKFLHESLAPMGMQEIAYLLQLLTTIILHTLNLKA